MIVYLIYMVERLILMRKVLKDTGSIYLHCDPTASHYLKIIMDGIFGHDNFVNEIIWSYKSGGASKKRWAKKHDVILMYSKTKDNFVFCTQYYKRYLLRDEQTGKELGKDPREHVKYYKDGIGTYRINIERDIWEIPIISPNSKTERMGYPTQKPLALLDKIIKASCPEDGTVLDPFCGCGTTLESAIINRKNWIGVDISNNAVEVMQNRIANTHTGAKYDLIHGNPENLMDYQKLNAYDKQEWLINTIGGFPNPKKSGDSGVDGDLTVHGGFDKTGRDIWHKVIFSVKTGNQCEPKFLRELIGTMKIHNATYGGLILDKDPSEAMLKTIYNSKKITYQYAKELPPQYFDTLQILTSQQIIDGAKFDLPPTINKIKKYRQVPTLDFG